MQIADRDLHLCARSSERVEIRFGHGLTAETAGVPSAHGISEDEDDVGLLLWCLGRMQRGQRREQKGGEEGEGVFYRD